MGKLKIGDEVQFLRYIGEMPVLDVGYITAIETATTWNKLVAVNYMIRSRYLTQEHVINGCHVAGGIDEPDVALLEIYQERLELAQIYNAGVAVTIEESIKACTKALKEASDDGAKRVRDQ